MKGSSSVFPIGVLRALLAFLFLAFRRRCLSGVCSVCVLSQCLFPTGAVDTQRTVVTPARVFKYDAHCNVQRPRRDERSGDAVVRGLGGHGWNKRVQHPVQDGPVRDAEGCTWVSLRRVARQHGGVRQHLRKRHRYQLQHLAVQLYLETLLVAFGRFVGSCEAVRHHLGVPITGRLVRRNAVCAWVW